MVEKKYFPITPLSFHRNKETKEDIRFSILIVSWNNLEYLKLCVKSILKNSTYNHQILVHVNEGTDGTLDWVKEQGFSYSHSNENIGICFGMNALSTFIEADYVLLIDDDNYVAPEWDKLLMDEIKKVGHNYFSISSTRMEPYPANDKTAISPVDFGKNPETFKEDEFNQQFSGYQLDDWKGSSWYPMVLHRDVWFTVGGLSPEFSPGMGSDPDFMMKLWQVGVRYFKGVSASRAYHFRSATTGRVKRNNGRKDFARKWRMRISTLSKYYIQIGQKFSGPINEQEAEEKARKKILIDRIRLFFVR